MWKRFSIRTQRRYFSLGASEDVQIYEAKGNARVSLDPIIDASFEGWYQRHAKRTLRDIEVVLAAKTGEVNVGVAMLKMLDLEKGYIYYIAVLPDYRGKRIGSRLLDYSMSYLFEHGSSVVYASLMQEHDEASFLFNSRGFKRTNFSEMAKKYGSIHTINLYRKMLVVSGEVVVFKEISRTLSST